MGQNEHLKQYEKAPFLLTKGLKVTNVSDAFCRMVKFSDQEILEKYIDEISEMLRVNFSLGKDCINNSRPIFVFTKFHEPVEVTVEVEQISNEEIIYIISKSPNSKIEDRMPLFQYLFKDNEIGMAVFAVPDIVLLKANQTYLNFFDTPYNKEETTIGRKINEFVTGWSGSTSERIWRNLLETGKPSHMDEYVYSHFERGVTYWNGSLIPIFENGSMKYVVEMTKDITDKVKKRIIMEEQARTIECQKRQLEEYLDETIKYKEVLKAQKDSLYNW